MLNLMIRSKRLFFVVAAMLAVLSCGGTGTNKSSDVSKGEFTDTITSEVEGTEVIHVDNQHPEASDTNPGTPDLPLKTVSAAAGIADDYKKQNVSITVLIHPGVYRESVSLPFNDDNSAARIIFQGTEKGNVIISGSDIWTDWVNEPQSQIYKHNWPYDWGLAKNLWASHGQDLKEIVRRREMVFVDGELLKQVLSYDELEENSFYVSEADDELYIWPKKGTDIANSTVEVAVRSGLFNVNGRINLEIRGIVFQHDNGAVDKKAVLIENSHNITIEDCYFVWNNWGGLTFFNSTNVTARKNVANHNGAKGMEAWKIKGLLFEDNETSYNNWRGVRGGFTGFAVAGLKHLRIHDGIYRNHTSIGNSTRGFWLDFDNTNIVIENAIWKDNLNDAIFIEANEGPITIKDSAICYNRQGRGAIIGGNSENVTLEGNLIYNNGNSQIIAEGNSERNSDNWETGEKFTLDVKNWVIKNNVIAGNGPDQLLITRAGSNSFLENVKSSNNIWINIDDKVFGISRDEITDFKGWKSVTEQDVDSKFENFMPALTLKHKELLDICHEVPKTPITFNYTPDENPRTIKSLFYKALSKLRSQLRI